VPAARLITALTLVNVRILGQNKNLAAIEAGKFPAIIVALSHVDVVVKNGAHDFT
jgi:hypothetical protein